MPRHHRSSGLKTTAKNATRRPQSRSRRPILEALEPRLLLTSDWQNPLFALDVTDDGFVAADDVITIINDINAGGSRELSSLLDPVTNYIDADGDQNVVANDVLSVINFINAQHPSLSIGLRLADDTGVSAVDRLTNDGRVVGEVTGAQAAIVSAKIRMNRGGVFEVPVDAAGNFLATPGLGGPLSDGSTNAKVYLKDANGAIGLKQFSFVLDATPPAVPPFDLDSASDTAPLADRMTTTSTARIVGQREIGSTVQLLGSSLVPAYEGDTGFAFAGLPFGFGSNPVSIRVTDQAGNESVGTTSFFRPPTAQELVETVARVNRTEVPLFFDELAGTRSLIFDIASLFDTTATDSGVPDTFSVYLVTEAGTTLVDRGVPGTALYSVNELGESTAPPAAGVTVDAGHVTVDVSSLRGRGEVKLVFEVFNADGDTDSTFEISNLALQTDPLGVAARRAPVRLAVTKPEPIPAERFFETIPTDNVEVLADNLRFDLENNTVTLDLRVVNNTGATLGRDLSVALHDLPSGVVVDGSFYLDGQGNPLVGFGKVMPELGLPNGTTSPRVTVKVKIDNLQTAGFSPTFVVWARTAAVEIFNHVRNAYDYVPYRGAMRGPDGVRDTKAGNAWDISSVLVEQLRANGIGADYGFGPVRMPAADVVNWVGAKNTAAALAILQSAQLDASAVLGIGEQAGQVVAFEFDHCWVAINLALPGDPVRYVEIDPSFKLHEIIQEGIPDIASLVPFDYESYLAETHPEYTHEYYASAVQEYLDTNLPGKTLDDVPYVTEIIPEHQERIVHGLLPFTTVATPKSGAEIPSYEQNRVIIEIVNPGGGVFNLPPSTVARLDLYMARDGRKPISIGLYDEGMFIKIGDNVQAFSGGVLVGIPYRIVAGYIYADDEDPFGIVDSVRQFDGSLGGGETIGIALDGGQIGPGMLAKQWAAVNANARVNVLELVAMEYFRGTNEALKLITGLTEQRINYSKIGLGMAFSGNTLSTGFEAGLAPDLPLSLVPSGMRFGVYSDFLPRVVSIDGATNLDNTLHHIDVYSDSDQERAVFARLVGGPGFNTVISIQTANEQGIPLLTIDSSNKDVLLPTLQMGSLTKSFIEQQINAGFQVKTPQRPTVVGNFSGVGFFTIVPGAQPGDYAGFLVSRDGSVTKGGFNTGPNVFPFCECAEEIPSGGGGLPLGNKKQSQSMKPATGELIRDAIDIDLPAIGFPLTFARRYVSTNEVDRGLGIGWYHTYSERMFQYVQDGPAIWIDDNGRTWTFFKTENTPQGRFITPVELDGTLTQAQSGLYTYREKDGTQHIFAADGRLIQLKDRYGNMLQMVYNNDNRLVTVYNTVDPGRYIDFEYDSTNHLTRAVDHTGRAWTYTYRTQGGFSGLPKLYRLDSVTTPSDANAEAQVTRYEYIIGDNNYQAGLLKKIIAPDGLAESFAFYPNRMIFQYTAPDGGTGTYYYDVNGRATRFIDERGYETKYQVDAKGMVIAVTRDEAQRTSRSSYEWLDGNLMKEVDPLGHMTTYGYDDRHNMTSKTDPLGGGYSYSYDQFSQLTSETDPLGHTTTYQRDGDGNLVTETDPEGNVTTHTYDGFGLRLSTTMPKGNLTPIEGDYTTEYLNDSAGMIVRVATDLVSFTHFDRDARGNLVAFGDANNHLTTFAYDILDRQTRKTDPLGQVAEFQYDTLDRLVATFDELGRATTHDYDRAADTITTHFADGSQWFDKYDVLGNLVLTSDQLGRATLYDYDPRNRLITTTYADGAIERQRWDYDSRLIAQIDARGGRTTFAYDPLDRLTSIRDALGQTTSLAYDAVGNLTRTTDTRGNQTQFVYDDADRLIETIDALTQTTATTYDANNNVETITDQAGKVTTFEYDVVDRLVATTDALSHVSRVEYDLVGNVTATLDANFHATFFAYDALDRLIATTDARNQISTNAYDAVGNLVRATDRLSREWNWSYDELDRVISQTDPLGHSVAFAYDLAGNLAAQTDELGRLTQYFYDSRDRQTSSINPIGGEATFSYDPSGNLVGSTDELARPTTYAYDALDRLTSTTDALAGVWSTTYDAVGNPLTSTDALGRVTHYAYDALNRLTTITDPLTGVWTTAYDSRGNVATSTDALAHATNFAYDDINRLIAITDADGGIAQMEYDRVGNLTTATDERGHYTSYAYDDLDRLTTTTDAEFGVWSSLYDAEGNLLTMRDALGREMHFVYDAKNRLIQSTDAIGGVVSFAYNAVDNLISEKDQLDRVTTYLYDDLDRLARATNPLGDFQEFEYDAVGNLFFAADEYGRRSFYEYDALNRVTQAADRLGEATNFTYDAVGNQLTVKDRLDRVTRFTYDALNRLTQVKDALDGTVKSTYDAVGNVKSSTDQLDRTTRFQYDTLDRLVKTIDPLDHETLFSYDAASNLKKSTDALGRETFYEYDWLNRMTGRTDPLGGLWTNTYDAVGNLLAATDELNRTTTFAYDRLNRRTSVTDPLEHTTTTAYDLVGNVLSVTDGLGHANSFAYDELNRQISAIDPVGGLTTYQYDPVGNLVLLTEPSTDSTGYEYDANDRLLSEANQLGGVRLYEYDAEGNRTLTTDRNNRQTRYTYDDLNRLTKEEWLTSGGTALRTFNNTFDAASQLLTASDPASSYTFTYDADGRMLTSSNAGTSGVPAVAFTYAYDAVDNLSSRAETIGGVGGATNAHTYDPLDRVTRITQSGLGASPKRIDMAYDAASQPVSLARFADLAATQQVATTTNAFDPAGRLTLREHRHDGNILAAYGLAYDAADRITQIIGPDGASNYTYDDRNQLTAADHTPAVAGLPTELPDENYSYDANGNRFGHNVLQNNRLQSDGTYNYQYDAEGNRTQRTHIVSGEVTEYFWDFRNRLTSVSVTSSGGQTLSTANYTYDLFNNRIAKSVDPDGSGVLPVETTRFVLDGDHIALQFDGAGLLTNRYLYGPGIDQILADEQFLLPGVSETLWPLTDHQGTVRDLIDSDGQIANHILYDSFGNVVEQTNAAIDHIFGFTGRERDGETGLMYYRARYYDPSTGQFISQDPIGYSAGDANLYRYVGNSPLMFVDPSGLDDEPYGFAVTPDVPAPANTDNSATAPIEATATSQATGPDAGLVAKAAPALSPKHESAAPRKMLTARVEQNEYRDEKKKKKKEEHHEPTECNLPPREKNDKPASNPGASSGGGSSGNSPNPSPGGGGGSPADLAKLMQDSDRSAGKNAQPSDYKPTFEGLPKDIAKGTKNLADHLVPAAKKIYNDARMEIGSKVGDLADAAAPITNAIDNFVGNNSKGQSRIKIIDDALKQLHAKPEIKRAEDFFGTLSGLLAATAASVPGRSNRSLPGDEPALMITASVPRPGHFNSEDVTFGLTKHLREFSGEAVPGTAAPLSAEAYSAAQGSPLKNARVAADTTAFARQRLEQTGGRLRFNLKGVNKEDVFNDRRISNYHSVTSNEARIILKDPFLRPLTDFYDELGNLDLKFGKP